MARRQTPPIKVLVVDDHRTFAEALALAIGTHKGFQVDVATNGRAALERSIEFRPDVVILDMQMPGMNGVEVIRRLRDVNNAGLVLALSALDEDLTRARALEAGAIGYLSKDTPLAELPELIRQVHRGEHMVDPREMHRLLRMLRHQRHQESTERQRANRLSPRHVEILQLMAEGLSTQEIATRLGVTPITVRTHVQNILMRLSVHTKVEALAVAIRHGKISAGT
jgi:DNA-binding NarL/FixJ family response regulator